MIATREELFAILVKKTEELGREATPDDFRNDPTLPKHNEYAYHYGSFENAAKQAYQKVRSKESKKKITIKKAIKPVQPPVYHTVGHTEHFGRPHN